MGRVGWVGLARILEITMTKVRKREPALDAYQYTSGKNVPEVKITHHQDHGVIMGGTPQRVEFGEYIIVSPRGAVSVISREEYEARYEPA